MIHLLIVAHGSRRMASNEEVKDLAAKMNADKEDRFAMVSSAFLELAEPSIPEGIERCIQRGATEVRVLPYFLSAGRHVSQDIPAEVDKKRAEHPDVQIVLTSYLGADSAIPNLMLELGSSI